jgi:hypothetical protein
MGISTTLDKVRLLIGDTDSSSFELSDDEINFFLTERADNIYLAAADCCDALAAKYARAYDFETDGQRFSRSQVAKAYAERAALFRARANAVTTSDSTRIDGYSQDITNKAVLASDINVRSRYYGRRDRVP